MGKYHRVVGSGIRVGGYKLMCGYIQVYTHIVAVALSDQDDDMCCLEDKEALKIHSALVFAV